MGKIVSNFLLIKIIYLQHLSLNTEFCLNKGEYNLKNFSELH